MITALWRHGASMLRQPIPQRCAGGRCQCVSADAHHTLLDGRIGAHFTLLEEKVNATFWPVYASIALREHSCPAYPLPKFPKQGAETIEVVQSAHATTTKM